MKLGAVVVERGHSQAVNAWLERVASGSSVQLLRACEGAVAALLQRTQLALGDATLKALIPSS